MKMNWLFVSFFANPSFQVVWCCTFVMYSLFVEIKIKPLDNIWGCEDNITHGQSILDSFLNTLCHTANQERSGFI